MTKITVLSLSEQTKDQIVYGYKNKATLKALAKLFSTSARTIGRVLEERGLLTPVPRLKGEAYLVMKLLEARNITPADLAIILDKLMGAGINGLTNLDAALTSLSYPRLNQASVQSYLNQCTKEQLASHFYASGLIKLAEITQEAHARKQQQAALFKQPVQQANLLHAGYDAVIPA